MARESVPLAGSAGGISGLTGAVYGAWRSLVAGERRHDQLKKVCIVLLIFLLARSAARFTWALLVPPSEIAPANAVVVLAGNPRHNRAAAATGTDAAALGEKLAALHLFGKADSRTAPVATTDAPTTTLSLALKGLLFMSAGGRSMAVIAEQGRPGSAGVYGVGDVVPGNATVEAIFANRVILRRSGQLEALLLEEKGNPSQGGTSVSLPASPEIRQISRQSVDKVLANLPQLAKQIQAHAHQPKGGRPGIALVTPDGQELFDREFQRVTGLQPGDILYEVNGIQLTEPASALTAFEQLRGAKSVRLVYQRGGTEQSMTVTIQ